MMISSAQLNQISSKILDKYSRDAAVRLMELYPEWRNDEPVASREQRISEIIRYGQTLGLKDDTTLFDFAAAAIRFNLQLPLPPALLHEFRQANLSRAAQLENVLLRLMSGRDSKTQIIL
jgi:hypothetical protein